MEVKNKYITPEFWRNKKVLVTGHTGFKGAWLSKILINVGADVYGYALKNEQEKSIFNSLNLENDIDYCYADIRNIDLLSKFVNRIKPEIVFHLAAQPIVRLSYLNPVETYYTNVMGTVNLLESLRSVGSVRAVVNVTTDKVYLNDDKTAFFNEQDRLGGYDPYSNSKACSDLITASYIFSFFNPEKYGINHNVAVATARAGNVIGGGDYAPDRLIPDCIRAIYENKSVVIRNPNSIRPWQNVLEPVSFYINLAEKLYLTGPEFSGAWNVGPDKSDCLEVKKVIDILKNYLPSLSVEFRKKTLDEPHEANLLTLDSSKAREKLGFKNKWSIEEAVKYTAMWYQCQIDNRNINLITNDIISKYFNEYRVSGFI